MACLTSLVNPPKPAVTDQPLATAGSSHPPPCQSGVLAPRRAHTDALTGLRNRRAWELELRRGLARASRGGEPLSLAVIDIDNFKDIYDRQPAVV
jgi:GGDEF domain-containing protein